jgi:hypothetical protein
MSVVAPAAPSVVRVMKADTDLDQQDEKDNSTKVESKVAPKAMLTSNSKNSDSYRKKKASVETLIKKTDDDISSTTTPGSSLQETLVNDARNSMLEARNKFKEAEKHDEDGDSDNAYSSLIDSERSAKEANLLIKSKERLEKAVKKEKKPEVKQEEIRRSSDDRDDEDNKENNSRGNSEKGRR